MDYIKLLLIGYAIIDSTAIQVVSLPYWYHTSIFLFVSFVKTSQLIWIQKRLTSLCLGIICATSPVSDHWSSRLFVDYFGKNLFPKKNVIFQHQIPIHSTDRLEQFNWWQFSIALIGCHPFRDPHHWQLSDSTDQNDSTEYSTNTQPFWMYSTLIDVKRRHT